MSRWSSSRVSCYVSCPLKYKLNYIEKWAPDQPPPTSELQTKGLAFHETVEQYEEVMSKEDIFKVLDEKIEKYKVDTVKYPLKPAIEKFLIFWSTLVSPKLKDGWKVDKEYWTEGAINRRPFCGALDLYLHSDNEIVIVDYKTGKNGVAASYKNQQILYAILEGQKRGWTNKQIAEKTKIFLFFPLMADLESKTAEQNMLRSLKELKFEESDVNEVLQYYQTNLQKISVEDFDNAKGNLSHECSWCQYCGAKPNKDGFIGCVQSVKAGFEMPPEINFIKKEKK